MNKIFPTILLIALSFLLHSSIALAGQTLTKVPGNPEAPEFNLEDQDGNFLKMSDYKGKVVIVNFWATWCPPCREEMPSMERLYREFESQGLVMLAVNVEANGKQMVAKFLQKTPHSFPILLDSDNIAQNAYGVFRFPESYIIDRNGVVVEKIIGGRDWMSGSIFKLIKFLISG